MSTMDSPRFACPQCAREYRWFERLAGKSAKCACGHVIEVPEAVSHVAPTDDEPIDVSDIYSAALSDAESPAGAARPVEAENLRFNRAVFPSTRKRADAEPDRRNFREIEVTWPLPLFMLGLAVGVIALAAIVSSSGSDKRAARTVNSVCWCIEIVAMLMFIAGPAWTLFNARGQTRPNGRPLVP